MLSEQKYEKVWNMKKHGDASEKDVSIIHFCLVVVKISIILYLHGLS